MPAFVFSECFRSLNHVHVQGRFAGSHHRTLPAALGLVDIEPDQAQVYED